MLLGERSQTRRGPVVCVRQDHKVHSSFTPLCSASRLRSDDGHVGDPPRRLCTNEGAERVRLSHRCSVQCVRRELNHITRRRGAKGKQHLTEGRHHPHTVPAMIAVDEQEERRLLLDSCGEGGVHHARVLGMEESDHGPISVEPDKRRVHLPKKVGCSRDNACTMELALPLRPDASQMDEFRSHVSTWLKLDADMGRLQTALRERRAAKLQLTASIVAFMMRFGIDDLDTRECRLSCRVRQVKAPLPHRMIHDRLAGIYADDPVAARTITDTVFNRDRVERVSLRRSAIARSRPDPGPAPE